MHEQTANTRRKRARYKLYSNICQYDVNVVACSLRPGDSALPCTNAQVVARPIYKLSGYCVHRRSHRLPDYNAASLAPRGR